MRYSNLQAISCRVVVTLLLMAAVTTVLLTPDMSDDVHAVMRSHQVVHAPSLPFALVTAMVMIGAARWRNGPASDVAAVHSLHLLCTCRC